MEDVIDERFVYILGFLISRMNLTIGTCLVNKVDGLVGEKTLIDIFRTCLHGIGNGFLLVLHMMEGLKLLLQTLNDTDGLFDGWLLNIYLLEAPNDSPRL